VGGVHAAQQPGGLRGHLLPRDQQLRVSLGAGCCCCCCCCCCCSCCR
jgi:hypothetical protein